MKGISITPLMPPSSAAQGQTPPTPDAPAESFTSGSLSAPMQASSFAPGFTTGMASAFTGAAVDTSSVKGKFTSMGERIKARLDRAVKAFQHRITYEEEVTRLSLQPVTSTLRRSVTRALLVDTQGTAVLRLVGGQQELSLSPEGKLSLSAEPLPAWQVGSSADRFMVRVSPDGLELQQGNSVQRFISNDWVAIGQNRFLLKILGTGQGAEHVHH